MSRMSLSDWRIKHTAMRFHFFVLYPLRLSQQYLSLPVTCCSYIVSICSIYVPTLTGKSRIYITSDDRPYFTICLSSFPYQHITNIFFYTEFLSFLYSSILLNWPEVWNTLSHFRQQVIMVLSGVQAWFLWKNTPQLRNQGLRND